jgi:hypothetical protein
VISHDITVGEILYAVLRVRFFWPLYALLYLYVGMNLKTRWVEYQTRKSLGHSSARLQPQTETGLNPPSPRATSVMLTIPPNEELSAQPLT